MSIELYYIWPNNVFLLRTICSFLLLYSQHFRHCPWVFLRCLLYLFIWWCSQNFVPNTFFNIWGYIVLILLSMIVCIKGTQSVIIHLKIHIWICFITHFVVFFSLMQKIAFAVRLKVKIFQVTEGGSILCYIQVHNW